MTANVEKEGSRVSRPFKAFVRKWRESDLEDVDKSPYPELWFAFIALVLGIVASVLSVPGVLAANSHSWASLIRDASIVFVMFILALFFYSRYRVVLGAKLVMKTHLEQQLKAFRELVEQQIEIYYQLMSHTRESIYYGAGASVYPRRFLYESADLRTLLDDSLDNVIQSLHEILKIHLRTRFPAFKEEISFSIKAKVNGEIAKQLCSFDERTSAMVDDTGEYVVTLARDQLARTRGGREVKHAIYSIAKNTAFRRLLRGGEDVFISNDLQQLANIKQYENETSNWRDNYNATLVVPVSHRGLIGPDPLAFGLLTVDSKNEGRHELFDYKETKQIMSFGADLLALVFLNLELFDSLARNRQRQLRPDGPATDPRKVFVAHGRNQKARKALFDFLRSLSLEPLEWAQLVGGIPQGSPVVGEVLRKGFEQAQAFVVLMTPDDEAELSARLRIHPEGNDLTDGGYQPRPNVIFEAGMAMGIAENRTILVEVGTGNLRQITDILGLLVVKMDGSPEKRRELARRLENSGCPVNLTGEDWLTVGDFGSWERSHDGVDLTKA